MAQDGYALRPDATALPLGRTTELRFRIVGPDGRAVTAMDVAHERPMHLIVVRRDLTGYQHLHPTLGATAAGACPCACRRRGCTGPSPTSASAAGR